MPSAPMYLQFPNRYSFNKVTSRHMLKSGRAYKSAFAINPDNFVESVTTLEAEARIPAINVLSESAPPLAVASPVIEPVRQPTEDKTIDKQRELIQQLIKQELAQNPKPYGGKDSHELDVLFRQLLVAKLLKSNDATTPPINKSTKPAIKSAKKQQFKFKVVQPQVDDDQDVTDEDEDE